MNIIQRLKAWWNRPVQLTLPFSCEWHGGHHDFTRDAGWSGFYPRCWLCGDTYDPVNDR